MQILNPRLPEEADLSDDGQELVTMNGKIEKKMAWLFLPPKEARRESGTMVNGDAGEVKLQIGPHLYWIQRIQSVPELCRLAVRRDSLILYEVLENDSLGISNVDLEDAVRQANGELLTNRDYHISDHIKRKLQILYAP